jgi:hypothetical protein
LRRAVVVVALLAICIAATSIGAHASGVSTASSWKKCGKIAADPTGHYKVSKKGKVTCRKGKSVIRQFLVEHNGTAHGGPYGYNTYYTLGRWKCGSGAGGGACKRRHPKARVRGLWTAD